MSIRSHRVAKVIYADNGLSFQRGTTLGDFLANHADTNDQTNMDGGGIIEFPVSVLKEAFKSKKKIKLTDEEIKSLKAEIQNLKDKDDTEFISYDMF